VRSLSAQVVNCGVALEIGLLRRNFSVSGARISLLNERDDGIKIHAITIITSPEEQQGFLSQLCGIGEVDPNQLRGPISGQG
jgi:hypothetical protein